MRYRLPVTTTTEWPRLAQPNAALSSCHAITSPDEPTRPFAACITMDDSSGLTHGMPFTELKGTIATRSPGSRMASSVDRGNFEDECESEITKERVPVKDVRYVARQAADAALWAPSTSSQRSSSYSGSQYLIHSRRPGQLARLRPCAICFRVTSWNDGASRRVSTRATANSAL